MPLVGETMYGKGFQKSYGGKGANQAVQAALLGAKTIMRGVIGGDTFGSDYISHLISVGVDTDHIAVGSRHTTGVATITVDDAGQNSIIIVPGANEDFTDSIIEENNSLIKSSNVLVCQNEIPVQATKAALISARQHGTVTILNPAPASTELISLVPYCDILCPNEVELAMLSGLEVKSEQEITAAAMKLLSGGCKVVLVTLGEKGACLVRKSGTIFFPTKAVNAVDTVGAGDSFIGKREELLLIMCGMI